MSRRPATLVAIVLLVTVALALPGTIASSGADAATNEVDMSGFSEEPGEIGLVLLSAQATNVTAYEANVTFDPDVVTVVAAGRQDFPNPEETVDREQGWVRLSAERSEPVDEPILASLVVRVLSEAEPGTDTDLSFVEADTTLTNATDGELSIDAYGKATVSVLQPETATHEQTVTPEQTGTPTATPTQTSSPTPTPTATPTPSVTPTATATPTATPDQSPSPTDTERPSPTSTPSQTSAGSPSPSPAESPETEATPTASPVPMTPTATDRPGTTTATEGPGFGPSVTLAALLVVAGLLWRGRDR